MRCLESHFQLILQSRRLGRPGADELTTAPCSAHQDHEHEAEEKQSLRMIVQALQEYSREAKQIFDHTKAPSKNEVIVLAEDLVQYALEVAETYPINRRYAGVIDYKTCMRASSRPPLERI